MTPPRALTTAARQARRLAGARGRIVGIALVASLAMVLPGAAGAAGAARASAPRRATSSPDSVCNYLYEWVHVVRFPIQADPHAAYTFVAISAAAAKAHVAFVVHGPFPYAAWTSWDVYDAKAKPTAVANDNAIVPDRASVNPFVVGRRLYAPRRDYTLLFLPRGVPQRAAAKSLQRIAPANVLTTPRRGSFWALAYRVYQAFQGYNQGGSAGPTATPLPTVTAVNYRTGAPVSCAQYNVLPVRLQRSPDNPPHTASKKVPPATITLTNGGTLHTPDASLLVKAAGAEYAPRNPPGLIQFTRPPLAAGADVSSIPPPDNCSGYLGTATSTTQISLIRMPRVPTFLDTTTITQSSRRPHTNAAYVSFTQYGGSFGVYQPGSPFTISLADGQLALDTTGGSTVVVWPRILTPAQRQQVFAYAHEQGWAIMRGGTRNLFTSANLLIREKGSSNYRFGVGNVPCYFGTPRHPMHRGQRWSTVTGSQYVASPSNIGPGAPQGVTCGVAELTDGDCLSKLTAYIASTGGSYFVR